jgi:transposase-like protein
MTERTYSGEPLDGTVQHITERPGRTVDATVDPEPRREQTTAHGEDDTDLQRRIKRRLLTQPEANCSEIAEDLGCCRQYVYEIREQVGHRDRRTADSLAELSETARQIVEMYAADTELTQRDIAAWHNVSEAYVSQVLSSNRALVATLRGDGDD